MITLHDFIIPQHHIVEKFNARIFQILTFSPETKKKFLKKSLTVLICEMIFYLHCGTNYYEILNLSILTDSEVMWWHCLILNFKF